ncbi:MAG: transposase [Pseudomonadota bacterium]
MIQIDEARIRDHLGAMVCGTVEDALNAMLDAEADRLCGAGRFERSEARKDTRAGSDERSLDTKAGLVTLKMPKPRRQTFETAFIERNQRREALWGMRVSPSTVSKLNKKIYAKMTHGGTSRPRARTRMSFCDETNLGR